MNTENQIMQHWLAEPEVSCLAGPHPGIAELTDQVIIIFVQRILGRKFRGRKTKKIS